MQPPPYPTPSEQPPPQSFGAYPPPAYQDQPQLSSPPYQAQPQPGYQPYQGQAGYWFPPTQPQSTGKIALKYGLIFGAILVGGSIIQFIIARMLPFLARDFHMSIVQISLIFSIIPLVIFTLINWSAYFMAGFFTARKGGTAITACLWATLCYFAIYCVELVINVILFMGARDGRVPPSFYFTSIGIGFVTMLILHGLGIGIGALGGLAGKNAARKQAFLTQHRY